MQLIQSLVEKTDRIVKATICLHNFLRQENSIGYCLTSFVDSYDEAGTTNEGQWRRLVGDNNVYITSRRPRCSRITSYHIGT